MRIGFIGLGVMGAPMARRLFEGGHDVAVLKSSKRAEDFRKSGFFLASSIHELAARSETIITMVPDTPDVERIVFGEEGIVKIMNQGSLFIDMSTIAPEMSIRISEELGKRGVDVLDAPVSGGQGGAESGTLSVMAGGTEEAFTRALPLLNLMGKTIVRIGRAGAGQTAKVCNQIMVSMNIIGVSEAMGLAKKLGIDLKVLRQTLLGGFAQSRILDLYGQRIIDNNFEPGFTVNLHRKDMNIALDTAEKSGLTLRGSVLAKKEMDELIENGYGTKDNSSLFTLVK